MAYNVLSIKGKAMIARTRSSSYFPVLVSVLALMSLAGCGGGNAVSGGNGGGSSPVPPSTANQWTWEGGSSATGASGVYGTVGVPSSGNVPGARDSSVSWTDSSGNFWLFGGNVPSVGLLNDLWEYSPSAKTWTWVSGSNSGNQAGIYGTLGVPSASNVPGGRSDSAA